MRYEHKSLMIIPRYTDIGRYYVPVVHI